MVEGNIGGWVPWTRIPRKHLGSAAKIKALSWHLLFSKQVGRGRVGPFILPGASAIPLLPDSPSCLLWSLSRHRLASQACFCAMITQKRCSMPKWKKKRTQVYGMTKDSGNSFENRLLQKVSLWIHPRAYLHTTDTDADSQHTSTWKDCNHIYLRDFRARFKNQARLPTPTPTYRIVDIRNVILGRNGTEAGIRVISFLLLVMPMGNITRLV